MKDIILNDYKYELVKNIKEAFDYDIVKEKITDYFIPFDYIVGDWAYGKLRLKGFYDENNEKCTEINNIKLVDNYIKNNCAYNCKHFILKKYVQK